MEELGSASTSSTGLSSSALSRSSEPLDQLCRSEVTGREKSVSAGALSPSTTPQTSQMTQKAQPCTKRNPLHKQDSAPQLCSPPDIGPPADGGTRDSSRSTSPGSVSSSRAKAHSGPPWSCMPGPLVGEEMGTRRPPGEASEKAVGSQESSDTRTQALSPSLSHQAKSAAEQRKRGKSAPPLTSSQREESVDQPIETPPSDFLSCGVTNDPSLWTHPTEPGNKQEVQPLPQTEGQSEVPESANPAPSLAESELCPVPSSPASSTDTEGERAGKPEGTEKETQVKQTGDERGSPEGETENISTMAENQKPRWEELVEEVVAADQSLARALYPLANRKTALMLMEQLLSEDSLLMEEHYKQKQERTPSPPPPPPPDSCAARNEAGTPPSTAPCCEEANQHKPSALLTREELTEKKRALVERIQERLLGVEETRQALQADVLDNGYSGAAVEALVLEHCLPVEAERYNLFIGDLERVVNLLLCLSARLARVQNALSTVDQHTDAEEKQSLDSRHRLLCKQRDDAKDLKDNLDRRERVVSTFLSRTLSGQQLQHYQRFVQTKASLLIRQKDLEERQRLAEEQLEALLCSMPP